MAALVTSDSSNNTIGNSTSNGTEVGGKPNGTRTAPVQGRDEALRYFSIFASFFVMIVGFFGNLLVILIFLTRWSLLKTCEVFMVSLAVADLIGTIVTPIDRLRDAMQFHDTGSGDFIGCQLTMWLTVTSLSVSSFTLVTIAIDRFIVVAWPLKLRQGPSLLVYGVIMLTWMLGGSIGMPHFVYLRQFHSKSYGYHCSLTLPSKEYRAYTVSIFVLQLVLPLLSMVFLYSFIILKLRSGSVSARRLSESDNVARIRTIRQRRATKLFVVVVIIFTVLVLPLNIFMLLVTYQLVPQTARNRQIYSLLVLLFNANSCVNPIIYSRLHKSFRKSFIALFFGCCMPKYHKYEWDSKFISRSSYYKRRRGTDQSNTRNTVASFRKSASPVPEDNKAQGLSTGTPPRTLSAVSSRSSRLSSADSDDVFSRKPSVKISAKNEDALKLKKIPEVNSQFSSSTAEGKNDAAAHPGKYVPFVNSPAHDSPDLAVELRPASDVPLHYISTSSNAEANFGDSSPDEELNDNTAGKFANNGYASLTGTPCFSSKTHLNDTEL